MSSSAVAALMRVSARVVVTVRGVVLSLGAAAVFLDLRLHTDEPVTGTVEALAAEAPVEIGLIVGRGDQEALGGLCRLKVPGRRGGARRRRGRVHRRRPGSPLTRARRRLGPSVRALAGPLSTVRLHIGGVQVPVAKAITAERFGGEVVPRFRLRVLQTGGRALMDVRIPVESVGAERGRARGDALGGCRHFAASYGM